MSLQQGNDVNTSSLSRTLQQSLQEVLNEVGMGDNFLLGAPSPAPALNPLLQQQNLPQNNNGTVNLPQNLNLSALKMPGLGNNSLTSANANALAVLGGAAAAGGAGTNFLSQQPALQPQANNRNANALAALSQSQMRPSEALGMSTEELLLAAATEKRMLEQSQQRMAARQQALAEKTLESRRLYQESLLALMKGNNNNTSTGLVGLVNSSGLQGIMQQLKPQPQVVQANPMPTLADSQSKTAIKVLGTSLRKKDSPYLDVSGLRDPDVSDKRTRGGVTEPFPEKLHRMLDEVRADGKDDVISFFAHGRAFAVHDPDRFTSEVMPKFFKQSRLSSFQRQLNLYGFTRITSGPDAGGYYHELFLQGRPNLAVHMRRVGLPQGEDRRKMRAKNMRSEPNFYAMGNVKDAKVNIPGLR